jgi:hypothetical protein
MISFTNKDVTHTELIKWKLNQTINPRTNKNITEKGNIYKYLQNRYNIEFPKLESSDKLNEITYSLIDSVDDKDPISLAIFWVEEEGNKKIIYSDISSLILYKDSHNLIRCFERETLEYLKAHNINKHPVTLDDIPEYVINKIKAKNLDENKKLQTLNDIALEIFQKFSSLSIFIDSELFMNLDKENLIKFNYEIKDVYKQNFTHEQLKEISNKILFLKSNNELEKMPIDEIKKYLLLEIDVLLSVKKEELKYMCNYILVGTLSIVIPIIREMYPDFCFSFLI